MDECVFCKIINGKLPSYKIYEDQKYLAFLNISQFLEGQTLVIPKNHYEFVWDVENVGEYFEIVQRISQHYKNIGYKYVDMMVFGRDIPHAHVRLFPHNDEKSLYKDSLFRIGELESDTTYMIKPEKAQELIEKLRL